MPQTADQVEIAPMPVTAVIGIDIAKHTMVLHDSVSQHSWTIDNTYADALQALEPFAGHDLAVCEATCGYERALLEAARTLNLPVHRADPAKAKAFIASHGGHAKTDKADARWLARLGLERGASLTRWSAPDPDREALTALVRYRQDLLKQRTAAKNRRSAPTSGPVRDLLEAEIAFLDGQIAQLDTRIDTLQTTGAGTDPSRPDADDRHRGGRGQQPHRPDARAGPDQSPPDRQPGRAGASSARERPLRRQAPHRRRSP